MPVKLTDVEFIIQFFSQSIEAKPFFPHTLSPGFLNTASAAVRHKAPVKIAVLLLFNIFTPSNIDWQ